MKTKVLSILVIVFVALLIVTLSITLPILFRPFYYAHIDSLALDELEVKGFEDIFPLSKDEIIRAYDEVMDFCTGASSEFSAGVLPYSEEGASHFADVRTLFILDFVLIFVSVVALVTIFILLKKKKWTLYRFKNRSAPFWSVVSLGVISLVVGVCCAINFRQTFIFFHKIFFIGKTNWAFDPETDPIIKLLPNQFFSNCAVLIFSCMILCCVGILLYEFIPRRKKN